MTTHIQALPGQWQQIQKLHDPREKQEQYARFFKALDAMLDEERKTIVNHQEILEDEPFKYTLWYWMFFGKILAKYKEFTEVDSVSYFLKSCQHQFQLKMYELERFIEKTNTSNIDKYLFLVMENFEDKDELFKEISKHINIHDLIRDLRNVDYEIRVATKKLTNSGESQFLLLKSKEHLGYEEIVPVSLDVFQNKAIGHFVDLVKEISIQKLNEKSNPKESPNTNAEFQIKEKKPRAQKEMLQHKQLELLTKEVFDLLHLSQKLDPLNKSQISVVLEKDQIRTLFDLEKQSLNDEALRDSISKWNSHFSDPTNILLLRGYLNLWSTKGRLRNKIRFIKHLMEITSNINVSEATLLKDIKEPVIFDIIQKKPEFTFFKDGYLKFEKGSIQTNLEKLTIELLNKL
jgi:hypothetical protein